MPCVTAMGHAMGMPWPLRHVPSWHRHDTPQACPFMGGRGWFCHCTPPSSTPTCIVRVMNGISHHVPLPKPTGAPKIHGSSGSPTIGNAIWDPQWQPPWGHVHGNANDIIHRHAVVVGALMKSHSNAMNGHGTAIASPRKPWQFVKCYKA